MFRFFRKHRSFVLVFLAACIGGLLLFGIGGNALISSPYDTILKVNGKKISRNQFDRIYNQMIQQQKENTTPQQKAQLQQQALNELIRQEVFFQESQEYGIHITDQELQMQLASIPAFQKDGKFDPPTYVRVVGQVFGVRPNEFEKTHRKDLSGRSLNQLIATSVHISDQQLAEALPARLQMETDKTKRKEIEKNPEIFRQEMRNAELNLVFNDWLNQMNSTLKVSFVSQAFQKSLGAPAQ